MAGSTAHDPTKLRLRKELTQIRKAAKVLRDPGTSSSWISPLSSVRSAPVAPLNGIALSGNPPTKGVFLYNWTTNSNDFDGDSVSDAKDSKCRDSRLIRPMAKPKACKPLQRRKRLQHVDFGRKALNLELALQNTAPSSSVGLSEDGSSALIDPFGDTEEYYNSEDVDSFSAESPLLSRLRHKKLMESISKFYRDGKRGDSSCTRSTPALSMSSFKRYLNGKIPSNAGSWDGASVSFNDLQDEEDQPGCGVACYWSRRSTPKLCSSPSVSDTIRTGGRRLLLCGSQKDSQPGQGHLPLLSNFDGGALGIGQYDDGEMELSSASRLDGGIWSSSSKRSQDEIVVLENARSLSHRYRPMFFHELVGQNIVSQSLVNAMTKGKISPLNLFQGPRGTGKTSAAKIFAAALNCLATEGSKPCGVCRECSDFVSCKSKDIVEVDGSDKNAMDKARRLLKGLSAASSKYKVFVIEECHLLSSKTWVGILKFLEESLSRVVFVFITNTTDAENVPRSVLSRCQRCIFNKIKDSDIVSKLERVSSEERLDVGSGALELIAMNSDGSLRDAETMLEQLSLLGRRITLSLVNELVGVVSEEKLLELLELAISSNTCETVKRARELLDSGADPLVLMSQLASLIMDIIAGNRLLDGANCIYGRTLTELELQKLKHALKLLSEAEKQLRVSCERSTWFTATLLQLGSTSPEFTLSGSGSSRRQSSKTTDEDQSTASRDGLGHVQVPDAPFLHANDHTVDGNMILRQSDMDKLDGIWRQCVGKCQHEKLSQLLHSHGKLISLSQADDGHFVAYIAFGDEKTKSRAERYVISITSSFELVLRQSVEVKLILLPKGLIQKREHSDKRSPMQRVESIIREQRLETAWLQAVEKGTPCSIARLQHEEDIHVENGLDSVSLDSSSHHWEDELNHEIEVLKVNDKKGVERGVGGRQPITPSLLQRSLSKEYGGYESGTGGCNVLWCLNIRRPRRAKIIGKTAAGSNKAGRFGCFRDCVGWRDGS